MTRSKADKKSADLGELVWVGKKGSMQHPAHLVQGVDASEGEDGEKFMLIQWQVAGFRQWVSENEVEYNLVGGGANTFSGKRRSRRIQEEEEKLPAVSYTAPASVKKSRKKGNKRMRTATGRRSMPTTEQEKLEVEEALEEDEEVDFQNDMSDHDEEKEFDEDEDEDEELEADNDAEEEELKDDEDADDEPEAQEKNDPATTSVHNTSAIPDTIPPAATDEVEEIEMIQKKPRPHRQPREGDFIFGGPHPSDPVYRVLGTACFNNRFKHIPDLLQLRKVGARPGEFRYVTVDECLQRDDPDSDAKLLSRALMVERKQQEDSEN